MRRLLPFTLAAVIALAPAVAIADGGPIMPLSQVQPGMQCVGKTVVLGTTISSFDVQVIDVAQDPTEGPRILVSVSGPAVDRTGVAEGFSGSPVYCPDAAGTLRNIGAISEGVGEYGNKVALVTPIEQMLGEPVEPPASIARLTTRARPLLGPLSVGGLSPGMLSILQRAGARAGRTILAVPTATSSSFPVQPLVPGASVAVSYAAGAIPVGAIGTVTYRDGQTVYAFGHPFEGAGRRSLILQDAYVYYVVANPDVADNTSYKLAAAGHILGTVTSDTPNAVIGTVGPRPSRIPVDVTARDLDTGHRLTLRTLSADETDVGMPLGSSLVSMIGPLEVAQAATQVYNGAPANESGQMCLTVTVRELRGPLRFCNRYVMTGLPGGAGLAPPALALSASTDAGTALGLIDQVQFAALHVIHVSARIEAQGGLAKAAIVSAHARTRVRAGSSVRVRLLIREYRGRLRTVSFRAPIPRDAHGALVAKIVNSATAGTSIADALANDLTSALSGGAGTGGSTTKPPPGSIPALRRAFRGVGVYDGLELKIKGEPTRRVFRDPARLITGSARLVLRVR